MDGQLLEHTKDTTYLITWCPKGENTTKTNIVKHVRTYVDHYLSFFDFARRYEFNVELNANGNIHFHGYVIVPEPRRRDWYRTLLWIKTKGFVKVNKVKHNLERAMSYCRKDRILMSGLLPTVYNPIKGPKKDADIRGYLIESDPLDEGVSPLSPWAEYLEETAPHPSGAKPGE